MNLVWIVSAIINYIRLITSILRKRAEKSLGKDDSSITESKSLTREERREALKEKMFAKISKWREAIPLK